MNRLKYLLRNKFLPLYVLLVCHPVAPAWGGRLTGGNNIILKDVTTSSGGGTGVQGFGYSLDFTIGEPVAGVRLQGSGNDSTAGYLAVRLGVGQSLQGVQVRVGGSPYFFQNGVQVGATVQAPIQITFTDQLDPATLTSGIQVRLVIDHLGAPANTFAPINMSYDPAGDTVIVTPQNRWDGNTLYSVDFNQNLLSLNGYSLDKSTSVPFMTALDPSQENVISNTLNGAQGAAGINGPGGAYHLDIPAGALSDFALVLFSPDPINSPLRIDPSLIRDANQKAYLSGGPYQTPVMLGEFAMYNLKGQPINKFFTPATVTLPYNASNGLLAGPNVPIRSSTLSMYILDSTHRLWVKVPESSVSTAGGTISASITQLSAFSLMGSASGSAADVYVFPNPWRPHGPDAGPGSGQTGTEAGGITFTNLPSECTISIYTVTQELVQKIHHSDATGTPKQETWDGKTTGGQTVASGVYLWRVESSVDGINGKLMIIR